MRIPALLLAAALLPAPALLAKPATPAASVAPADRLVPLEQGSNFRDVGGYPAAGGKHVRWGMIYRSGATPMLTDADLAKIKALNIQTMVDLRSSDERVAAPTKITGISYTAVGYPMADLMTQMAGVTDPTERARRIYVAFPTFLKPQLKIIFADLMRNDGPIVYNCSAGQDRTGFATAMILSALGVPRDVIVQDYLLSTGYRRPQFEGGIVGANGQPGRPPAQAAPLYTPEKKPYLDFAFEEIDRKWGSVDAYLQAELGIGPVQRAQLRAAYLE